MSVETFDIRGDAAPAVTVTGAAAGHLLKQLAPKGLAGVRIFLEKSGCTGYKYEMAEVAEPEEGDVAIAIGNGLTLWVPARDLPQLNGMELDFVQEGVNRRLVMNNPNVRDACGCGESFSFED